MTLITKLLLSSLLICSCNFGKGVKEETRTNIKVHKMFIKSLSFSGAIVEKIFCEKCELNKFQIVINLKGVSTENISIGNYSFQPYYYFNRNSLNISVVKELYEFAQRGLTIEKNANSYNIIVGDKEYKLINLTEEYKWLP